MLCWLLVHADLYGPVSYEGQNAWRQTKPKDVIALAETKEEAQRNLDVFANAKTLVFDTADKDAMTATMREDGISIVGYKFVQEGWLFKCKRPASQIYTVFLANTTKAWRSIHYSVTGWLGGTLGFFLRAFDRREELFSSITKRDDVQTEKSPQKSETSPSNRSNSFTEESLSDVEAEETRRFDEAEKELLAAQTKATQQRQALIQVQLARKEKQRLQMIGGEAEERTLFLNEELEARNVLRCMAQMENGKRQEIQRGQQFQEERQGRDDLSRLELREWNSSLTWYHDRMQALARQKDAKARQLVEESMKKEMERQQQDIQKLRLQQQQEFERKEREIKVLAAQKEQELEQQKRKQEEQLKQERQEIAEERQGLKSLYGESDALDQENKALKKRLDGVKKFLQDRSKLESLMQRRTNEATAAQKAHDEAQQRLREEQERMGELNKDKERVETEKRKLEQEHQELMRLKDAQGSGFKAEYDEAQKKIDEKEKEIGEIRQEIKTKQAEIEGLEGKLQTAKAAKEKAEADVAELNSKLKIKDEDLRRVNNVVLTVTEAVQKAPGFSEWGTAHGSFRFLADLARRVRTNGIADVSDAYLLQMRTGFETQVPSNKPQKTSAAETVSSETNALFNDLAKDPLKHFTPSVSDTNEPQRGDDLEEDRESGDFVLTGKPPQSVAA